MEKIYKGDYVMNTVIVSIEYYAIRFCYILGLPYQKTAKLLCFDEDRVSIVYEMIKLNMI